MKPIGRIQGNTITFFSRRVPGITSVYAWLSDPSDVKREYDKLIENERRYLANGPKPILSDWCIENFFAYGMERKFTVNVMVGELAVDGLRTYGRPCKHKEAKQSTRKDIAYRVKVKIKPEAIKELEAKIQAERDSRIAQRVSYSRNLMRGFMEGSFMTFDEHSVASGKMVGVIPNGHS